MIHEIKQIQFLPIDVDKAWSFFSRPENLAKITPPELGFQVRSVLPDKIYPGMMIVYKIRILGGIPIEWVTEITHMREPYFFVDEQRFGPYALWHHEHHFKETPGGMEMTDIVHYKLPFGSVGNLFHSLLVKPQLKKIFDYRTQVLESMFSRAQQ